MALDPQMISMTLISGLLVGILLGTFGGGGSVLAAPLLLYAVGMTDTHLALGTSAAGVAAIALVNLVGHWRAGRVRWKQALAFAATGLTGAILGSSLAKVTDDQWLLLAFAGAMGAVALAMVRQPAKHQDSQQANNPTIGIKIIPTGLTVGTASGFFGIGGGFLIVPGLMASTGMPLVQAAAASLVSVATFGAATSVNYALSGLVSLPIVTLMLIGGAGGGAIGLQFAKALAGREAWGRRLFAGMIMLVALFVAIDAVIALAS